MACSIVKHRGSHLLYIFLRGQEIAQSKKSANKIIKEVGSPRRSKNRTRLKATPNENAIDMFQRTKRLAKETLG